MQESIEVKDSGAIEFEYVAGTTTQEILNSPTDLEQRQVSQIHAQGYALRGKVQALP